MCARGRNSRGIDAVDLKRDGSGVDVSVGALSTADRHVIAVMQRAGRRLATDDTGQAEFARDNAACAVRPPLSVTIAATRRITGSQSGSVISATRTSPSCTASSALTSRTTRTRPLRCAHLEVRRAEETPVGLGSGRKAVENPNALGLSALYISPSDAFLPPTFGTSARLISESRERMVVVSLPGSHSWNSAVSRGYEYGWHVHN